MPHIVLNGEVRIKEIFPILQPLFFKDENRIIKSSEFYISRQENTMIVKTLSIEGEKKVSFFILINDRDDGIVIRLLPDYDIPKTKGVKKSLALIANQIRRDFQALSVGKTNLTEYL